MITCPDVSLTLQQLVTSTNLIIFMSITIIVLTVWLCCLTAGLLVIAGTTEMSFQENRRKSLIAGFIIMAATALLIAFLVETDRGAAWAKDFILLFGSVIGGGLLVQGFQKKIR